MQMLYRLLFIAVAALLIISANAQTTLQSGQIACKSITAPVVLMAIPVAGQTTISVVCLPVDNVTIKVVSNKLVAVVAAPVVLPVFVDGEVPGGVVDGVNTVFTLSNTPAPVTSVVLYRNGIRQKAGADYNIAGATITFLTLPLSGDLLLADYRR